MHSLHTHLHDLPLIVLRGIAQNQGLLIEAESHADFVAALAAQMQMPVHVHAVIAALPAPAQSALQHLLAAGNRLPVAVFQRRFGEIRRFGGGRLQQERPWAAPASVAETLWYHGLILRGFDETPAGLAEFFAISTDLLPHLPPLIPAPAALALAPVVAPAAVQDQGERFLEDLGSLLIYVQGRKVWLDSRGRWRPPDLAALSRQWLLPPAQPDRPLHPGDRPALLFHCAHSLGLLAGDGRRQRLHSAAVRDWLQLSRPQQAQSLFTAWRHSPAWNDLCRTPGLRCQEGAWRNDPLATRQALLDLLASLPPDHWFNLDELAQAVQAQRPDFQRPDGDYDTWYISDEAGVFLRGFEHWPQVEGRLLRHILTGPLHWLGAVALDGERACWRLTSAGQAWLHGPPSPTEMPLPPLVITADFRVLVPIGAALADRVRVARFCEWEASWPGFRYRITQRGLRRLAAAGVLPSRVINFLEQASDHALPGNVRRALAAFAAAPAG